MVRALDRMSEPTMPAATVLLSGLLTLVFDQATKALVVANLREGHARKFGWLVIRRSLTRKGPWAGWLRLGDWSLLVLLILEVALFLALTQVGPFFQNRASQVALGAALGGAGGNVLDRLRRGGVVDFIDVGAWPVFNLADVAIVAGSLLVIALL